jgi:hypothetical protein
MDIVIGWRVEAERGVESRDRERFAMAGNKYGGKTPWPRGGFRGRFLAIFASIFLSPYFWSFSGSFSKIWRQIWSKYGAKNS